MSYLRIGLAVTLWLTCEALAGNFYRDATVISMYTVPCNATGFMATMSGSSAGESATCSEYVMVSESVEYRIRPHKNRILLPVGEAVQFAFAKSHLLVRPDDSTEAYEFDVMSMQLGASEAALRGKEGHGKSR